MRAAKIDANQEEIVAALRKVGATVQSLAGIGQTAANTLTNAAANYGNTAGQGITDLARVNAAGYQGAANALGTGVSQYLGQMNNSDLINALRRTY